MKKRILIRSLAPVSLALAILATATILSGGIEWIYPYGMTCASADQHVYARDLADQGDPVAERLLEQAPDDCLARVHYRMLIDSLPAHRQQAAP